MKFYDRVCHRYALIFKDLSPTIHQELKAFIEWGQKTGSVWSLLTQSTLSSYVRTTILHEFYDVFNCHEITRNVLNTLSKHHRIGLLSDSLELMYCHYLEKKTVYLHISKALSPKMLSQLQEQLGEYWKFPVQILQKEVPDLLEGAILLWDNLMLDFSLRSFLETLQQETFHALSNPAAF